MPDILQYAGWQTIATAAASFSVLASVILIMLSRFFGLRALEQTAKSEFVYAASTVFIVLMAIWFIQIGEPVFVNVADNLYKGAIGLDQPVYQYQYDNYIVKLKNNGEPVTLIDYTKLYLEAPASCSKRLMRYLYIISIPSEVAASIHYEIFMSEIASGFAVKGIVERINNTNQLVTFYLYIYYLLGHMLNFLKHYGLFFFSVGVAARAFPPTRGAGAYLMALSIGLYFVFPLSYILVASTILPQVHSDCVIPEASLDVSLMQCGTGSVVTGSVAQMLLESSRDDIKNTFEFLLPKGTQHLVSAVCLFPIVAMTLVLTFVLNGTNLFGGNIPEIGRGLVRLI